MKQKTYTTVQALIAWADARGVDLRGKQIEVVEDAASMLFCWTATIIVYRYGMMVREKGSFPLHPLPPEQVLLVPWFVRFEHLLDRMLQAHWARAVSRENSWRESG